MKLFLLSQKENTDWDTYDSLVVCAANEDEARKVHPEDRGDGSGWVIRYIHTWCLTPEAVTVEYIGEAAPHVKPGVVLGSFNAG